MIELSKLNTDKIFINERWIESIEALPDTTITLSSGNKFVVLEPMQEVMHKIVQWQSGLFKARGGKEKGSKKI